MNINFLKILRSINLKIKNLISILNLKFNPQQIWHCIDILYLLELNMDTNKIDN